MRAIFCALRRVTPCSVLVGALSGVLNVVLGTAGFPARAFQVGMSALRAPEDAA